MELYLCPVSGGSVGWAVDERLPRALVFWDNFLGHDSTSFPNSTSRVRANCGTKP